MQLQKNKCTECGTVITEQMMVGVMKNGMRWGLTKGEMGDSSRQQRMYIKVKCAGCGCEYLARMVPGPHGGTIALGAVFRPCNDADFAKPAAKQEVPEETTVAEEKQPEPDKPVIQFENKFAGIDMKQAEKAAKAKKPIPGTTLARK